ncbi:MAG: ABC transporter ATP-binding protein [Spirochaetes bacterium]|uniref:ABC transporter ATP-binding protein n=1 Tax=Candidatus Ornithospirochaeta stercoravium TaxID=2840897 RepID=A0A9D9IAH7_9SPIO|nr:ABC transporter ATP-binding protein [Candidatus Ornithospirochaeta stercoravium]
MLRSKGGGARAKDPKKALKRVLRIVFGERKKQLVFIAAAIVISSFSIVYSSSFLGKFIDDFVTPLIGVENPDWHPVVMALAQFAAVVSVSVVFNYFLSRMMACISQDTLYDIRVKMFEKMESLPISYFDQHQHGEIMSRFSNDTDTLNQFISHSLVQLMQAGFTLIMVFVAMVMNSLLLTAVVLVFAFLTIRASTSIAKRSGKQFAATQENLASVNGFIEEMMNGQRIIKVFCHEGKSKADFGNLNENLRVTMTKANTLANIMGPVTMNIGNIQYVVLVVVGAVAVILSGGHTVGYTIGALAAFLQLARSFSNNINQISQQMNMVLLALAGAERIFELMDEESETDDGYVMLVNSIEDENGNVTECESRTGSWAWKHPHHDGSPVTYTPLRGDIVMHDVDFGYVPDKTVLHDISLYAKPGQKIAFVGSTGAGKTTITNLLNRFYDIQDGKIRFDGININKIKKADLRHSLGMILQDTNLFTGTIRDNIRFGKLDASDEEVISAARLANAHDFIMMMPDGYDTKLTNNGESLSQGQRQLIAIARAAIANPPVLVMDEATSSIDTHTEALVQGGMDKLMANRTVFVIAHRLSTVRNSDAIMVLDHGRIIERGTHEQLIAEHGVYYQLYTGAVELE